MGFNSWYALHSHLDYPSYTWHAGFVLADAVKDIAVFMKANGFLDAGYNYINLDDCIMVGRNASGHLVPDPQAFPNGVADLADYLHGLGFKFGLYTDRGNYTCSCYAGGPKRPGSLGYEKLDAQTYASWTVDYLKEDSCFNPNNENAFQEYATMRDALNATGRPVYFSACYGDGQQIAQVGYSLANEWRIAEDDGSGWAAVVVNIDTNKDLWPYAGPGGWNDMGLLTGGYTLNDTLGRSQFNFWCVLANKLLISADPRNISAYQMQTYLNKEAIAVDQDPLGKQGRQWFVSANNQLQVWGRQLVDGFAMLLFNGADSEQTVGCSGACWANMNLTAGQPVAIRDLWLHQDLGDFKDGYEISVSPLASVLVKISPHDGRISGHEG